MRSNSLSDISGDYLCVGALFRFTGNNIRTIRQSECFVNSLKYVRIAHKASLALSMHYRAHMRKENNHAPKQILIADDEESFRYAASLSLRQEGYEVSEAINGEEAFEMIMNRHVLGHNFDLIILDIQMPKILGTDLLDYMRGHGVTTPVVIVSGYADERAISSVEYKANSSLLRKPFESEQMISMVELMMSLA